jgi:dipeptidyl aminopeptidase/acylaminoacyl peptidase
MKEHRMVTRTVGLALGGLLALACSATPVPACQAPRAAHPPRTLTADTLLQVEEIGDVALAPAGQTVVRSQAADRSRPLPIEVLLGASSLAPYDAPTFTPDGLSLAYTVLDPRRKPLRNDPARAYRTGVPWAALGGDIWLFTLATGDARNLTQGVGNNWSPSWSPDGRRLAFLSDRMDKTPGGEARLWIWERSSDAFRQVIDLPLGSHQGRLEWTADGRDVVIKLCPEGMTSQEYAKLLTGDSASTNAAGPDGGTAKVFGFDPTARDAVPQSNQINLDNWLGDLALVDVETGTVRRMSHGLRIGHYAFSPDRKGLAWVTVLRYERPGSQQLIAGLTMYDLNTGASRQLVKESGLGDYPDWIRFSWSSHGGAIAFKAGGPRGAKDDMYAVSVKDGTVRRVAEGLVLDGESGGASDPLWADSNVVFGRDGVLWRAAADGSRVQRFAELPGRSLKPIDMGSGQLWSPDDGRTAIVFTFDPGSKRAGLARVDLRSGAIAPLFEEGKHYGGYGNPAVVTPDKQSVLYVAEDARNPPQLWLARGSDPQPPRQVSRIASELGQFELGNTKLIEWRGLDGDTLRGALMYPVGYKPGLRYPLIVKVYGGSGVSNDFYRFGFAAAPVDNLQIFASRGYAVLYADSKLRVGTPMLDLLKSVLPGVDRAVEIGLADPDRIGLIGHSYGGYSTLSLIVQSQRFKAAVASAATGDLVAAYGALRPDGTNYLMSWAETGQGRMGGSPWDFRERYIENSPVFYLDRVTAPVLLINGAEDIAPTLADQVFSSLRRLGKRVEYARYAGESHWEGGWSLPNQKDYLARVIAWFDRYLRAEAHAK